MQYITLFKNVSSIEYRLWSVEIKWVSSNQNKNVGNDRH